MYQFVITLFDHRYFGKVLVPTYIIQDNDEYLTIYETANIAHLSNPLYETSAEIEQIIRFYEKYTDKKLFKIFSKAANITDFYAKLTTPFVEERIKPYVAAIMAKMLQIISKHNMKLYTRWPGFSNLYENDKLLLFIEKAHPTFYFTKHNEGLSYTLTISTPESELSLLGKEMHTISNHPCLILIENCLFLFSDIDAKKLQPFVLKKSIEIPKSAEKKYFETFILACISKYEVVAEGFDIADADPNPCAILAFEEDLSATPVLNLRFRYGKKLFWGEPKAVCDVSYEETDGHYKFIKFARKASWENRIRTTINNLGVETDENDTLLLAEKDNAVQKKYALVWWLNTYAAALEESGIVIEQVFFKEKYFISNFEFHSETFDKTDWFDLHGTIIIGDIRLPFVRLRKHILNNIKEYPLSNGFIFIIPDDWFTRYQEIFKFGEVEGDILKLPRIHHALIVNHALPTSFATEQNAGFDSIVNQPTEVSPLVRAELRQYQKEGYWWMMNLNRNKFGGCLADDMGLGKTLQTLTLLQKIYETDCEIAVRLDHGATPVADETGQLTMQFDDEVDNDYAEDENKDVRSLAASIVVMPKSLLHNWYNEIKKFTPNLKVYVYNGVKRLKTKDIGRIFSHYHVVLTSYGTLRIDLEYVATYKFNYLILDESHYIKNPASKIYQAVNQIEAEHRLAITGTPIENSLHDLWAQFNFINPGILGSFNYFKTHFVLPITKQKNEDMELRLKNLINPYILRRTKQEVAKDLPLLAEQTLYCDMSEHQKKKYIQEKSGIRNEILETIDLKTEKSRFVALQALMKLRLLANHPVLADAKYTGDSGKFEVILNTLENLKAEGHKTLIFSSFVKHLRMFESYFEEKKWKFSMLTGQTVHREKEIEQFQKDPENQVFLISIKAGGVGLNLTAADYVFILDPWWNPAAELQAINRAHRIGQDKNIMVYRFITNNSIEEKIAVLQQTKLKLADTFINPNNPFENLSDEEIKQLFS